jgi:membrane-bound lytic murein transglycosylase D
MKRILAFFASLFIINVAQASFATAADQQTLTDTVKTISGRRDTVALPAITILSGREDASTKHKLELIQQDIPLDYNEYVQSYIDFYASRKDEMARTLGLSSYYFPRYEKSFRTAGVPEEMKYLSVVESALNPTAMSKAGAAGPWQFLYATGHLFGLNADNYVDERRDPILASDAAAACLKDAYQDFGDWLVAIASYNCGKNSITRAIEKAGARDFWSIRPFLPIETRNYVPAYIAMVYVMNYYNQHGIMPRLSDYAIMTDTIRVNKFIPLNNIARVLNIEPRQMFNLNPQYKMQIVNGTDAAPKRLVIPKLGKAAFAKLYDALLDPNIIADHYQPTVFASVTEVPLKETQPKFGLVRPLGVKAPAFIASNVVKTTIGNTSVKQDSVKYEPAQRSSEPIPAKHVVQAGETLAAIADKYHMEVNELKAWNHLSSQAVKPGTALRLQPRF